MAADSLQELSLSGVPHVSGVPPILSRIKVTQYQGTINHNAIKINTSEDTPVVLWILFTPHSLLIP